MADPLMPKPKTWRRHAFEAHWERKNSCRICGHTETHRNHATPHEPLDIDFGRMFADGPVGGIQLQPIGFQPKPLGAHVVVDPVSGGASVCYCELGRSH